MPVSRIFDPNMPNEMTPVGSKQVERPAPIKESEKEKAGAEKFATIAEVQKIINDLTKSIKEGFPTKAEVNTSLNSLNTYLAVLQGKIPNEKAIKEVAKTTVTACLRDLDSAGTERQGNVLMLQPGSGGTKDSTYFGTVKASGGAGFDWSKVSLGFTISGTTVTVLTGTIDRIVVPQTPTPLTVANDYFTYVRRTIANDTMLVVAAASVPADDATYKYYRLHQFSVTGVAPNEVAALKFALRPFDIEAGGAAFDWSKVALGHKVNPDGDNTLEVRIYAGEVKRFPIVQTDLVLALSGVNEVFVREQVAECEYIDTPVFTVEQGAVVPRDSPDYLYYPLCKFVVSDSVIDESQTIIRSAFNIHGEAVYGYRRVGDRGYGMEGSWPESWEVDENGAIVHTPLDSSSYANYGDYVAALKALGHTIRLKNWWSGPG